MTDAVYRNHLLRTCFARLTEKARECGCGKKSARELALTLLHIHAERVFGLDSLKKLSLSQLEEVTRWAQGLDVGRILPRKKVCETLDIQE